MVKINRHNMIVDEYKHLFIIGAAKSGTSFLYENLINHPKLVGADKKELSENQKNFKEPQLLLKKNINREKFLKAYKRNLRDKPSANILVDATTDYTKWPYKYVCEDDINKITNNFLCIYVIRDPIDRFESHINYKYSERKYIIKEELDKIIHFKNGWLALNIGNYAMQLNGYKNIHNKGKLLIVDFNEMIKDPKKCLKKICKKIDIDINELPKTNHKLIINKTEDYVSKFSNNLIFKSFPVLNSIYIKTPTKLRTNIKNFYRKLYNQKPIPKRILTDSEKFRLAMIYKPSLIKLQEEYGIDYFEKSWSTIKKYL